jgi:hypothetical protein
MCNEHWQSATCMVLQLQVKSKYKDWEILLDTLSISIYVMTKINNPQKSKTMCPFLFSPPTPNVPFFIVPHYFPRVRKSIIEGRN